MWNRIKNKFPRTASFLRACSLVKVDLGGFHHRNESYYTFECLGLASIVLVLAAIYLNIKIMEPALSQQIERVASELVETEYPVT